MRCTNLLGCMFLRESSVQAGCYSRFHVTGVEREALLVPCLSGGAAGECLSPMKHLCALMQEKLRTPAKKIAATDIFVMLYI